MCYHEKVEMSDTDSNGEMSSYDQYSFSVCSAVESQQVSLLLLSIPTVPIRTPEATIMTINYRGILNYHETLW